MTGDNSFEIERALDVITANFDGVPEKINADTLQLADLPDLLMGTSLFATQRLLIIRNLSNNRTVWPVFGDWLARLSDDIHLVLIEPKIDKRTATFRALKEIATIQNFATWSERDIQIAERWVIDEAKQQGVDLNKKLAQLLVQRVGVNQWQLFRAIEKLSLSDEVSEDLILDIIDINPTESVFNLFEIALSGDTDKLISTLRTLEQTEDVYRLSALLFSQAFQLAALVAASSGDDVAKDFAIHPFVVSKLRPVARKLDKTGVSKIITILTELDSAMKTSSTDPWILVEDALLKITNFA